MAIQVLFLALGLLALFALAKHLLQIRAANKKSSQWRYVAAFLHLFIIIIYPRHFIFFLLNFLNIMSNSS